MNTTFSDMQNAYALSINFVLHVLVHNLLIGMYDFREVECSRLAYFAISHSIKSCFDKKS